MLLSVLAAALAVQAAPDRRPPEFTSEVRMIRLDVSVVDRRGRSVAGLGARDFKVTEDGKPVALTFFEAVAPPPESLVVTPEGWEEREAPEAARRVVLLLDTGGMSQGQLIRARDGATQYLREQASGGDWVRMVNLSTGRSWDGHMPEDRARMESAARSIVRGASLWADLGRDTTGIETRVEVDAGRADGPSEAQTAGQFLSVFAETAGLLGTLESTLVQMKGVPGRKALVLVSPGFPQLRDFDVRLERVASLAREGATAVYFVDVFGLDGLTHEPGKPLVPAFESAWTRSGGAMDLAEATGGFTSRFANSLLPALSRVADEMRTYYVVGYVPDRAPDGKFRSVKVEVQPPGLSVRTKKGYLADGR